MGQSEPRAERSHVLRLPKGFRPQPMVDGGHPDALGAPIAAAAASSAVESGPPETASSTVSARSMR